MLSHYPFWLSSLVAILFVSSINPANAANRVIKAYEISDIAELVVNGAGNVQITQGETESLEVEAEPEVIERIGVDLTRGKLTLSIKTPKGFLGIFQDLHYNPEMVTYRLQLKDLHRIVLSGATHTNLGEWSTKSLKVYASGASKVTFKKLGADSVWFDLTGASEAHLEQLMATNTNFTLSGASNIDFNGVGKVDKLKVDASGASNFHGKKLEARSAEVELSGASNCEVYATVSLSAETSGASHIQYAGNPKTTFSSSGVSDIKSIQ